MVLLACGCTADPSSTAAVRPTAAVTSAALQPFATCTAAGSSALTALAGVDWQAAEPAGPQPDCTMTLTAPGGGRLELRYQPANNAVLEAGRRLADLPTPDGTPAIEQLSPLGVGLRSGGVAFRQDGQVSLLLYLATSTSLVSIVCVLPAPVLARLRDPLPPRDLARALTTWALARQPHQLAP